VTATLTERTGKASAARSAGGWTYLAVLRDTAQRVTVCAFVVVVTFLLVRIVPGDAVTALSTTRGSPEARAALRAQLHLDEPLATQFSSYLRDLAHGNLGQSLVEQGRPVTSIIAAALPVTLCVVAGAVLTSLLFGTALGLAAAMRPGRIDLAVRTLTTVLLTLPPFFLGLLMLFAMLHWPVLPAGGWAGSWPDNLRFMVLPCLALSGYLSPLIARTVRQAARHAVQEHWVEGAIVRGVPRGRLLLGHILPNSLLPVVSLIGYNVGAMISGAVIVESVFGLPGFGQQLVNSIALRDYPVIQGIALVSGLFVVAANLLTDILVRIIDPRVRRQL